MKYNKYAFRTLIMAVALLLFMSGCKEDWLDTKALSFYTPDNTYVDAAGFYAALTTCERNMLRSLLLQKVSFRKNRWL